MISHGGKDNAFHSMDSHLIFLQMMQAELEKKGAHER